MQLEADKKQIKYMFFQYFLYSTFAILHTGIKMNSIQLITDLKVNSKWISFKRLMEYNLIKVLHLKFMDFNIYIWYF